MTAPTAPHFIHNDVTYALHRTTSTAHLPGPLRDCWIASIDVTNPCASVALIDYSPANGNFLVYQRGELVLRCSPDVGSTEQRALTALFTTVLTGKVTLR